MKPNWQRGFFLNYDDLTRLLRCIDEPRIDDLRRYASQDEVKPQGIHEKWSRGRCIEALLGDIIGREIEIDGVNGLSQTPPD